MKVLIGHRLTKTGKSHEENLRGKIEEKGGNGLKERKFAKIAYKTIT